MMNKILLSAAAVFLCACDMQNASDMALQQGYTNNINLLQDDKNAGISRKLLKTTQETVDTSNDIHQKIIEITEELEIKGAKGTASSVTMFDSGKRERMGKRSISVSDNGTVPLTSFVEKFETVQVNTGNNAYHEKGEEGNNNAAPTDDAVKTESVTPDANVSGKNAVKPNVVVMEPIAQIETAPLPTVDSDKKSAVKSKTESQNNKIDENLLSVVRQERDDNMATMSIVSQPADNVQNVAFKQPKNLHDEILK